MTARFQAIFRVRLHSDWNGRKAGTVLDYCREELHGATDQADAERRANALLGRHLGDATHGTLSVTVEDWGVQS